MSVRSFKARGPVPRARDRLEFRAPEGDLRHLVRNAATACSPPFRSTDNLEIGLGRFLVPELAQPRTHMETDRQPTAVRPRDRGIAAIGVSYRF